MAHRSSVVLDAEESALSARILDPDAPYRILVMGDFTGRDKRKSRPTLADLDNFDEVMSQMLPSLSISGLELEFRTLDDFHPDQIAPKLPTLPAEPPRTAAAATSTISGGSLLESIVEQTPSAAPPSVEEAGDLAAFIRRVTAPYLVERPDASRQERLARENAAKTALMRVILHHPQFQALESTWRAAWMLIQRLGDDFKVYLLDTTLDDVLASPESVAGEWTLLVGNYSFSDSEADARRLHQLGRIAQAAGAPFIAEGQPPSSTDDEPHWRKLRESPEAHWLGLVLPRFLLRLPYGKDTSPIESFPFEELNARIHTDYLWGNPAFACAYLMARHGGAERRISGLPVHDGQPCAEILMSEKDASLLMERGIMPLASLKDQDAALIVRFQSIAHPIAALAGDWSKR